MYKWKLTSTSLLWCLEDQTLTNPENKSCKCPKNAVVSREAFRVLYCQHQSWNQNHRLRERHTNRTHCYSPHPTSHVEGPMTSQLQHSQCHTKMCLYVSSQDRLLLYPYVSVCLSVWLCVCVCVCVFVCDLQRIFCGWGLIFKEFVSPLVSLGDADLVGSGLEHRTSNAHTSYRDIHVWWDGCTKNCHCTQKLRQDKLSLRSTGKPATHERTRESETFASWHYHWTVFNRRSHAVVNIWTNITWQVNNMLNWYISAT